MDYSNDNHSYEKSNIEDCGHFFRNKKSFFFPKKIYMILEKGVLSIGKDRKSIKMKVIVTSENVSISYIENSCIFKLSINNYIVNNNNNNNNNKLQQKKKVIALTDPDKDLVKKWVSALKYAVDTDDKLKEKDEVTPKKSEKQTKSMNDFEIISVIGKGSYGKVMLCKDKATQKLVAIKSVRKCKLILNGKLNKIYNEKEILEQCSDCPFIVNVHYSFETDSKLYIVMDYLSGGELFFYLSKVGTVSLKEARFYIAEITEALLYLHSKNLVYRDLKPENILLDENGHLRLSDFGLVKDLTQTGTTSTFCGTIEYMAPEIVQRKKYSSEVDWWALGVLTYELIFGDTPFADDNQNVVLHNILNKNPIFPTGTDPTVIDFISSLLQKKPERRMSLSALLRHPFFMGINFNDVREMKLEPSYVPAHHISAGASPHGLDKFDKEFTDMCPHDSVDTPIAFEHFDGFSLNNISITPNKANYSDDEYSDIEINTESDSELDIDVVLKQF